MTWQQTIAQWQNAGKQIVFTNGCFDVLHRGHVRYLKQAQSLGDVLVLGLNSDASVKRLKGPTRPFNDQDARKEVLEALRAVDLVVLFDEDTPLKLIETISPNILVKGGDYQATSVVGYEHVTRQGGRVEILPFVDGYSSTRLIDQMH